MPRRLLSQLTEVIPRLTWHQQQQVLRPAWWWAARTPAEQEGPPLLRRRQARREAPWLLHLAACPPACSVPPSCRHDRSLTPTRRCLPPTVWLDLGLNQLFDCLLGAGPAGWWSDGMDLTFPTRVLFTLPCLSQMGSRKAGSWLCFCFPFNLCS